jgi:hypothetical protein
MSEPRRARDLATVTPPPGWTSGAPRAQFLPVGTVDSDSAPGRRETRQAGERSAMRPGTLPECRGGSCHMRQCTAMQYTNLNRPLRRTHFFSARQLIIILAKGPCVTRLRRLSWTRSLILAV